MGRRKRTAGTSWDRALASLTPAEVKSVEKELEGIAKQRSAIARSRAKRARFLLKWNETPSPFEISNAGGGSINVVRKWKDQFRALQGASRVSEFLQRADDCLGGGKAVNSGAVWAAWKAAIKEKGRDVRLVDIRTRCKLPQTVVYRTLKTKGFVGSNLWGADSVLGNSANS